MSDMQTCTLLVNGGYQNLWGMVMDSGAKMIVADYVSTSLQFEATETFQARASLECPDTSPYLRPWAAKCCDGGRVFTAVQLSLLSRQQDDPLF